MSQRKAGLKRTDWRCHFVSPLPTDGYLGDVVRKVAKELNFGDELPAGWRQVVYSNYDEICIVDEKNRNRVTIMTSLKNGELCFKISLLLRYAPVVIIDDDNGKIIGQVIDEDKIVYQERRGYEDDLDDALEEMYMLLTSWLNENLPDWENFLAYWDCQ